MMIIKALTLWPPWGQFMAKGLKKIETRSWYTAYRGPLAIHSGARIYRKEIPPEVYELAIKTLGPEHQWQLGKILCIVNLNECLKTAYVNPNKLERMLGNYELGRYAWCTSMIKVFQNPVPARGMQRMWEWQWDNSKITEIPKGQMGLF